MDTSSNNLDVKLVIYKKIVEGDLSKFTATSNITPSGGGARDLRFSPATEFFPVFQRMFTQNGPILSGYFSWVNHADTRVEIHPPTNARPNEVRIGRIHECFPQDVIPNDSSDCVLLIILDSTGRVSPYFTSQASLQQCKFDCHGLCGYRKWKELYKWTRLVFSQVSRPKRMFY